MKLRQLTEGDVKIELIVQGDRQCVRGNALVSGDAALDKAVEDEILERLRRGDVWAWAEVEVRAT